VKKDGETMGLDFVVKARPIWATSINTFNLTFTTYSG
jgi:hypothetical protein